MPSIDVRVEWKGRSIYTPHKIQRLLQNGRVIQSFKVTELSEIETIRYKRDQKIIRDKQNEINMLKLQVQQLKKGVER
jgi:hypothetical protein